MASQGELSDQPASFKVRWVEYFWSTLSREQRVQFMTFSIQEVKAEAAVAAKTIERDSDGNTALL